MEEPAVQESPVTEVIDDGLRPPERRSVRRRLIQSTLLPHKSPDNLKVVQKSQEDNDCKENEDEDEEYCGSQSKKKRQRKKKATPQSRASKKVAINAEESQCGLVDDTKSPIIAKSDFFVKNSEKRLQKKQQKQQQCLLSPEENNKTRSPSKRQKKQQCLLSPEENNKTRSPSKRQKKQQCILSLEGNNKPRSPSKQQKKQLCLISPEGNNKICSSSKQEKKQQCFHSPERSSETCSPSKSVANTRSARLLKKGKVKTTPIKNVTSNGSSNPESSEHASPSIPDLWLEAKMTAEENSRMSAGRQIHPFFSLRKSSNRNQVAIEVESGCCLVERKDKSVNLGPIHVFETIQDDVVSIDWRNWEFCDRTLNKTTSVLEGMFSSIFEGSAKSLHFDNMFTVSHPLSASILHNDMSFDQCAPADSATLADEHVRHSQLLIDIEAEPEVDKVGCISGLADHLKKSDDEQQSRFHKERMMSHYRGCGNMPDDSLWTKKYQPEKAMEVCGNGESVKSLSEWLHFWHACDFRTSRGFTNGDKCIVDDLDRNCYESDSDSEDINEGAKLKNVLLVSGPVGSGKSAAIYACAREQGFEVIEVNTSDWRNGNLMKQKFGEAVESHRIIRSVENQMDSQDMGIMNSSPAKPNNKEAMNSCSAKPRNKAAQGFDEEVVELISLSDGEDSCDVIETPGKSFCKESRIVIDRCGMKSLILFEDVDITFVEDRGFITAIQQLAEISKLPMILTTNSNKPVLPDNLDRLELCFTLPSSTELLRHASMVCAAEKAYIQPHLIERFIGYFHGDIRKTIMHLQFWCQGKSNRQDSNAQKLYGPLLFDIDAGHHILPKIIPWDLPSQLSELIEKEITNSLFIMEENFDIMEVDEEEELGASERQTVLEVHNNETVGHEAKKEAMLSMNHSLHDCNEFEVQFDTAREFSSSSGSPVAFARRKVRRKLETVTSFSSGDEFCNDQPPVVSVKDTNDEVDWPATQHFLNRSLNFEGRNLEKNRYQCSDTTHDSHIDNEIFRVVDVSFVPESLFVPETEFNCDTELLSGTISCGHVTDTVGAASTNNELVQEVDNPIKPTRRLCKASEKMRNACDVKEEMGDSQNEHTETVTSGYQVMDECSRMDFNPKKRKTHVMTHSVQETWKKLRGRQTDLKQYVTSEPKDACRVLQLACGMSNLISEADLLLSNCQFLTSDSANSSMVHSEETDAFNWCNEQLEMTSTISQHGFCFYAKDIASVGTTMGSETRVDLAREMLASMTNTMAFGKLARHNVRTNLSTGDLETMPPKSYISLNRERVSDLTSIVQSIVPSKSYLTLKGDAFHEYLSSLAQISRSEASRLSENVDQKNRQRRRVARHYLSSNAIFLPPTDISLLDQYNCFGKFPFQSMEASLR